MNKCIKLHNFNKHSRSYIMAITNKPLVLIQALGTMSKQKRIVLIWLIEVLGDIHSRIASYEQIADGCGVPLGTTTRILQNLQNNGLIERHGCVFYLGELLK